MDKYYIPEIEEFHVGFEYEYMNSIGDKQWYNQTVDISDLADIMTNIDDTCLEFRVKYLDQSDIESLGFELKDVLNKEDKVTGEKKEWQLLFSYVKALDVPGRFRLYFYPNAYGFNVAVRHPLSDGPVIFKGKLKNKSELKKLLKQIGIKEDE